MKTKEELFKENLENYRKGYDVTHDNNFKSFNYKNKNIEWNEFYIKKNNISLVYCLQYFSWEKGYDNPIWIVRIYKNSVAEVQNRIKEIICKDKDHAINTTNLEYIKIISGFYNNL